MEVDYLSSTYYQIRLTAKYLKIFSTQMFAKIGAEISFDEYIALELLKKQGKMCQRDLAKLLLKDRANTGRICNSLCDKQYITINIEEKNKRPVKNLILTDSGEEYLKKLNKKIEPLLMEIMQYSNPEEEVKLQELLTKGREMMEKIVDIQI